MCRASTTIEHLRWANTAEDAGWRETYCAHESYRAHLAAGGLPWPVLLLHAVGLRVESITIDVLHTVDQGIAAHIIGNIIFIYGIYKACVGGANYAESAKKLAADLKAWCQHTKCDSRLQGDLMLERIWTSGQWPKLKGKAVAIRRMAKYALELVQRFHYGSDHDNMVEMAITLLVRFCEILYSESQFCSPGVQREQPLLGQKLSEF